MVENTQFITEHLNFNIGVQREVLGVYEAEKAKLQYLLERKKKADSLPLDELQKFKKHYDQLLKEIAQIEQKIGGFNFEKAMQLLHQANLELNIELTWSKWGNGVNKFLEDNQSLNRLILDVCDEVDKAFAAESMSLVESAVKKYREAFIRVNNIYNDTGKQMGFRELIETDAEYRTEPWREKK
jgi:hypothetical protein